MLIISSIISSFRVFGKGKTMKGNLYVISAPSGAGKTSLVNALLQQTDKLVISISHTTRPKRPAERPGFDYYFVDKDEFQTLIKQDAFFEYAEVYGHYYGTTKQWVMEQLELGLDVILEIDWQGAQQIMKLYPNAVSIFVFPPSRAALLQRLQKRGQDESEVIDQRMAVSDQDISHAKHFDYWVVNNVFANAVSDLEAIVRAQRLRRERQEELQSELVKDFLAHHKNA